MLNSAYSIDRNDYAASRRDRDRRDSIVWWICASFVPCSAANFVAAELDPRLSPRWIVGVCAAWLAVYVIAARYRLAFRCPRCLQPFFGGDARAPHCTSCGLHLGGMSSEPRVDKGGAVR